MKHRIVLPTVWIVVVAFVVTDHAILALIPGGFGVGWLAAALDKLED